MRRLSIISAFLIAAVYVILNSGLFIEGSSRSNVNKKRIVIITLDTLRYDHLGYSGYGRNTSPNIDAFSDNAVFFTNAYSVLPTTDPAHTSIMTGLYPRVHEIMGNGYEITKNNFFSIASWAKSAGITKTAAIVSRVHLNPDTLGIGGFDYISVPEDERKADETFNMVEEWLKENGDESYLLWIHYFDPHYEYEPPYPFNSIYNDGYRGQIPKDREFLDNPPVKYTSGEIDYMISLYDGEIAYMDYYFGKTIREIEKYITDDEIPPLYAVASDHGENMAELQDKEDYAFDHGEYLSEPAIKTVTVLRWEGKINSGEKLSYPVQQIDIAPTIVELFGYDPSEYSFNGKSLAGLLDGKGSDEDMKRTLFVQRRKAKTILRPFLAEEQIAAIKVPWKLIASFPSEKTEFYNLETDSSELNNIAGENNSIEISLLDEIKAFREKFPYAYAVNPEISPEKARDLKALGYVE